MGTFALHFTMQVRPGAYCIITGFRRVAHEHLRTALHPESPARGLTQRSPGLGEYIGGGTCALLVIPEVQTGSFSR